MGRLAGIATALAMTVLAIAIVAIAVALWWWHARAEIHVQVTQQELQTRLAEKLSRSDCRLIVACFTVTDPVVTMAEGSDRIALAAKVGARLGRREHTGELAVSGTLRYVQAEGQLFLDAVSIDRLAFEGLAPEVSDMLAVSGRAALRDVLQKVPIHSLEGRTSKEKLARLVVRDVRVVDGKVRVTLAAP